MSSNPFGDLEEDFKQADKAEKGSSIGRLPEGVYKVVCKAVDLSGDGNLVDHQVFETKSGTKGLKLFMEILEPEKVGDVKTKGEVHENVFWITKNNLPYVKRDAAIILGRDLESLAELAEVKWAGKTCEIGLKDDTYNGFTRSKISFINPWKPNAAAPKEKPAKPTAAKQAAPVATFKEEETDF